MRTAVWKVIGSISRDENGSTLAEYALISFVLGTTMIASVLLLQKGTGQQLDANASGWIQAAINQP